MFSLVYHRHESIALLPLSHALTSYEPQTGEMQIIR